MGLFPCRDRIKEPMEFMLVVCKRWRQRVKLGMHRSIVVGLGAMDVPQVVRNDGNQFVPFDVQLEQRLIDITNVNAYSGALEAIGQAILA